MRTFSREAWTEAQELWRTGAFSDEWRPFRHQAAMRGMLYPPDGTRWDSSDDEQPSQRAIIVRAIRDTPGLLSKAIDTSRSWGEVVGKLIAGVNGMREDADERESWARRKRRELPEHIESAMSIKAILQRLGDS